MRRALLRFVNLFRTRAAEREMSREMAAHLALLQEDFEKRGLGPEQAALAARRAFRDAGAGVEQAKELHRAARSFLWVEQFFRDLAYGWNSLRRKPGFTLTAVSALGLGIGLNATVFGVYDAIALKPLPVAEPDGVVRIERWFASRSAGSVQYNFAYPEYEYLRDNSTSFSSLVAATDGIPVLAGAAENVQRALGEAVSANYFAALGVTPRLGRTFLPAEDRAPGGNPVLVLDYRFWQARFRGREDVLGSNIKLNGASYTIVGVAPSEFTGTGSTPSEPDFWAPLAMLDQLDPNFGPALTARWRNEWRDPLAHPGFELLARLKPGVSRERAQTEAGSLIRRYLSSIPQPDRTNAITLQKTAYFGNTEDVRFKAVVAGMLLVVSLVLFVACANVANMLLARGLERQREIGIRLAIGASRGRILRQLLTESLLLSLFAGDLGLLLSIWGTRLCWTAMNSVVQGTLGSVRLDLRPDLRILSYCIGLSLATAALFGLLPAVESTRMGLHASLTPFRRSRMRSLLLGAQAATCVLLLVLGFAAASMVRESRAASPGFETRDVYPLSLDAKPAQMEEIRDRLRQLPQLAGVASGRPPLYGTYSPPIVAGPLVAQTLATYGSDEYLKTTGIRLLNGRSFTPQEARDKAHVAVISESTARHLWPHQNPLGRHFALDLKFLHQLTDFEVVGIAGDTRPDLVNLDELHVYLPSAEVQGSEKLMVRIRGNREAALAAVRSAVASVDPALVPGLEMTSLENSVALKQRRFLSVTAATAAFLATLSLILAAVGIYGVTAFFVSQRSREIGIRVALGANARRLLGSIVAQGLRPVFAGTVAGVVLGAAANIVQRAMEPFPAPLARTLFGDASIYGGLAAMLATAVLASIIPARRALRVDPAVTLREQ